MARLDKLLLRFARPADRAALRRRPGTLVRLRAIAGIALRFFWLYVLLFIVGGALTVGGGADIYHRTEVPRFCGGCHEMDSNFDTWAQSQHESIKCVDCHARPGLSGWISAKTAGTTQLLHHFTADSIDDISLKERHRAIVSENCQRCHPGARRLNERHGLLISHERHDELGLQCVACHAGNIAHPKEVPDKDNKVAGLVDIDLCFTCHDGKQEVGDVVAFNARNEDNCGKCHPDSGYALAHGKGHPSAATRKPCLSCHDAPVEKAPHFKWNRKEQAQLCSKCHEPAKDLVSTHKPYAEGKCDECHLVMSPSHLFRVGPKPNANFCLGCHEDLARVLKSKDPKVISGFADIEEETDLHRYHADELADDPRWCATCHAAHGSKSKRGIVLLKPTEEEEDEDEDEDEDEGDDEDEDEDEAVSASFEATETGGRCSGSCHEDDTMEYDRGRLPAKGGAR